MSDFLRRIWLPLLFTGLLLLTLIFMLGDREPVQGEEAPWPQSALLEVTAPLQKLFTRPAEWLGEVWTGYIALVDVRAENQALERRITLLEEDNLQYREALVASGHLARIARMRVDFEVPLLPSQVVGQDVSPWFRSMLLDRGRDESVRSGMPVVSAGGLVGVVTATSPNASRAMILLDRRSAVDAIVQRSRARGIVRGTGSGEIEFVFMVRGDDVRAGDEIITSGVGGVYPKGLRIGVVTAVHTQRSEILHTAEINPAVDFGRLEQVFVMLERSPTLDLLFADDGDEHGAPPEAGG